MGWIDSVIGGGAKGLLDGAGAIIDRFHLSPADVEAAKREMAEVVAKHEALLQETLRAEIGAKERILVAALQQGGNYTKRLRPTVGYVGLFAIAWNFVLIPTLAWWSGKEYHPVEL